MKVIFYFIKIIYLFSFKNNIKFTIISMITIQNKFLPKKFIFKNHNGIIFLIHDNLILIFYLNNQIQNKILKDVQIFYTLIN